MCAGARQQKWIEGNVRPQVNLAEGENKYAATPVRRNNKSFISSPIPKVSMFRAAERSSPSNGSLAASIVCGWKVMAIHDEVDGRGI